MVISEDNGDFNERLELLSSFDFKIFMKRTLIDFQVAVDNGVRIYDLFHFNFIESFGTIMFFNCICSAAFFLLFYIYYWFKYWGTSFRKLWIPVFSPILGFIYGFLAGAIPCIFHMLYVKLI